MTCTHCGDAPLSMEFRLGFELSGGEARQLDLHLCHDCLAALCADPSVELVETPAPQVPVR